MSLCSKCGGLALSGSYDCRHHIRKEKIDDDPVISECSKWRCMSCGSLSTVWQYSDSFSTVFCLVCEYITLEDKRKPHDRNKCPRCGGNVYTGHIFDYCKNCTWTGIEKGSNVETKPSKLSGFNESDLALEVLLCAKIRNFLSNHDPRHWSDMREYIDIRELQLITRAQELGIGQEIEAMINGAEIYFSHEVTD